MKEAGVDLVKLDGAADYPEAVSEITRAGIPVFAQFGITPQTALRHGVTYSATPGAEHTVPPSMLDELVAEAKALEAAGASLLNFTNSGPVVGPVVGAVARQRSPSANSIMPWCGRRLTALSAKWIRCSPARW